MDDPQLINGTCAQFLPVRSELRTDMSLSEYCGQTQDDFWGMTENACLSLEDVFASAGLPRDFRNKVLFLFQPFEPALPQPGPAKMKWLAMKGAQIRMYQPYVLVVEFAKNRTGHALKLMYDDKVFQKQDAEIFSQEICRIVDRMSDSDPGEVMSAFF